MWGLMDALENLSLLSDLPAKLKQFNQIFQSQAVAALEKAGGLACRVSRAVQRRRDAPGQR